MEKSLAVDFQDFIIQTFELEKVESSSYSPLVLAYIGDGVYDVIIKSMVINRGNRPVQQLHGETSYYVKAATQSLIMRAIQEQLNEVEQTIYRRGRNAKSISPAKNQSITDYRRATGFEALVGYLYLEKQYQRLMELITIGLASLEQKENKNEAERAGGK